MDKTNLLKRLLDNEKPLIMPDAYDPISAKIIEYAGFKAIQCSGYSFSISKCYKKEIDISLEENLSITKSIVDAVNIPVMADGEDGYGNGNDFIKNIDAFIKTGIAGINIEDQNLWNKNNKSKIIDEKDMIDKIKSAIEIKIKNNKPDFIINARTDALSSTADRKEAQKIAIERANKYLEAGADLSFITGVKTLEEVKLFSKEVNGPLSIAAGLLYNINEFSINDCKELKIARVSLPSFAIFSIINPLINNLKTIMKTGDFSEIIKSNLMFLNINELNEKLLSISKK